MWSPSRSASARRLSTNSAAPSPITKPSAPSAYGRVPLGDSAPIAQNFTKLDTPMLRSTPPVTATSYACSVRPSTAAFIAAIAEAQAASTVKFGPWRLKRLAIRPAMQLLSSPGIESSVIPGSQASTLSRSSPVIAVRTSAGSAAKLPARSSSRASSGYSMRRLVW